MRKNNLLVFALAAIVTILLFACSDEKNLKDLRDYVAKLSLNTSQNKAKSETLSLQLPTAVTYQSKSNRSPFQEESTSPQNLVSNPLQAYPLEVLQLKGTIEAGNQVLAFVEVPDGKVYQVKLGDVIGDHYGKIVNISPDSIEVEEQVNDDLGHMTKRIGTIELKD